MDPKSRVFEGKTLEEAVSKGLAAFGLSRAEAMITTMQEGSGGFFGLGARPFKVRIQPRPGGAPRDADERSNRSDRGRDRDRGARPERGRGGRGGDRERARGGRSERGGRPERAAAPARAESGRGGARTERERGGRSERGERHERAGGAPAAANADAPARSDGRERDERRERGGRDRGGRNRGGADRGERGDRGDRAERGEREARPAAAAPVERPMTPAGHEVQPGLGARGFEDRRRPGDRREETGAPPSGTGDRRSGDDRRQLEGAEQDGDPRRRRRRGRRGGRGRRRGGAAVIAALEHTLPAGPATAEAMASDLPTTFETVETAPISDTPPVASEPMPAPMSVAPPAPMADEPPPTIDPAPVPRAPHEDRRPFRGAEAEGPMLSGDELVATSRKVTEELFRAMGFEGKVNAQLVGPDKVEVVAEVSDDEELLTGRKGETRQALQHLLNRMVNKGEGSRYHLQLEINDFWKHREEELAGIARRMADDAVTSGQEQVTDFLNSQERRIIHVTLREDTRVRTFALGDGMVKRLTVAPAHAETVGGE